jgi:hypothetical protein
VPDRAFKIVRLTKDVKNPDKDGRYEKVYEKGSTLIIRVTDVSTTVAPLHGQWSHQNHPVRSDAGKAILEAAVDVPPEAWTFQNILGVCRHVYGHGSRSVLEVVCEANPIVMQGLIEAVANADAGDHSEYEYEEGLKAEAEARVEAGEEYMPSVQLWDLAWKRSTAERSMKLFDMTDDPEGSLPDGVHHMDYSDDAEHAWTTLEWVTTDARMSHDNCEEYREKCRKVAVRWLGALGLPHQQLFRQ